MATKRITDLPQIDTGDIDGGKEVPIDDIITQKITLQQIADFIIAQVPPAEAGGSPITAVQQNVINEQNNLAPVAIKNAGWDSYTDNSNLTYTLADNYAQGATSIELTCVTPESTFKPVYPCRIIIYDETNKSYGVLTGFTSGTNYTLAAALVNQNAAQITYSTSTAVIKLHTKTRRWGIAIPPSGTTGQIAAAPEDLLVKYLEESVDAKKLTVFRTFNAEEFLVVAKPSATTTEISSIADKSAVFPSGTKFIAFHKKYMGVNFQSLYTSGLLKNFLVFTCSAASSFASSKILLTHSATSNSNIALTDYYIMKLPTTKALVEADTAAGTPAALTVKDFLIKTNSWQLFYDTFTGADNTLMSAYNDWSIYDANYKGGTYTTPRILSNLLVIGTANSQTNYWQGTTYRSLENYKNRFNCQVEFDFVQYRNYYAGSWAFGICTQTGSAFNAAGSGYGCFFALATGATATVMTVNLRQGNTTKAQHTFTCTHGVGYKFKMQLSKTLMKIKIWLATDVEPEAYSQSVAITDANFADGEFFSLFTNFEGMSINIDNLRIKNLDFGATAIYELENQTGDKVTIATLTEIASAANEVEAADYGVGFIIQ